MRHQSPDLQHALSATGCSVKVRIRPESYADRRDGRDSNWTPFRPGMSATVEIETEVKPNVLAVPIKAVTTRADSASAAGAPSALCVFLLEEGKAAQHNIVTGIQDNNVIELLTELPVGATVITGPYDLLSRKLNDGDGVQAKEGKTEGAAQSGVSISFSAE